MAAPMKVKLNFDNYLIEESLLRRFKEIHTRQELLDKLNKTEFTVVRSYESYGCIFTICKCEHFSPGYVKYLSMELAKRCQLDKVPVEFRYQYFNLLIYAESKDIDEKCLLTETVYVNYINHTSEIVMVEIGPFVDPNELYLKQSFDGFKTEIERLYSIPKAKRIEVLYDVKPSGVDDDIPQ